MVAIRLLLLTFAFLSITSIPALAEDYIPILPGNTPANTPERNDANNPAPGVANHAMKVPDYIKPGFQMIYMVGSYTKTESSASAGMGFTVYTILAVLNDKVLVSATNYLTPNGLELNADGSFDPDTDSKAQLSDSASYIITKADVMSGGALWMPVDQLKQWKTTKEIEVIERIKSYQGEMVNAISLAIKNDGSITIDTFHADNGLKLEDLSNHDSGKQVNQMQLLETKQLDSPLLGAKWPDWAKTVKKMSYSGTYTMAVAGVEPLPMQIGSEVVFKERGDGWAIGKASMTTQGQSSGSSHVMQGPGTLLGYWVHPGVLADLAPGLIEENKLLRTTTTYQVQDGRLGRLGVFFHTNKTKSFYTVSGYNLQTGALTYVQLHTAETGITIELSLDGIESE